MGSESCPDPADRSEGLWALWAVAPQSLDARLVETFEAHGPALAALIELAGDPAWADHRLVLTSRPTGGQARLPVQRVDDALAWASCLVGCADGRRHVRA